MDVHEEQFLDTGTHSKDIDKPEHLLSDLKTLINSAKEQAAQFVNAALSMLYWQVGDRIRREVLQSRRADYGDRIIASIGKDLESEYGRGFSEKSIRHMLRFAEAFPDFEIVSALLRQLSWTHFKVLIYMKNPLQRAFYAEMARMERWSTRVLQERVQSMLYERTALSKNPEEVIVQQLEDLRGKNQLNTDLVFRDPYVLDFLGLKDVYSEKDFENALLREMESFLLELGAGFAFVERQKRFTLDGDDYYIDLLFYHRKLKRLVAVELKIGDFKPGDASQIELYLRWLDRYEKQDGEEAPIGLILCAGKKRETVEMLELHTKGIHIAEYLTGLPPRNVLEERLHLAIQRARRQSQNQDNVSEKAKPPP